jgi:hypothetical protein
MFSKTVIESKSAPLEDHSHLLPDLESEIERELRDVLAVYADLALVRHEQSEQQLEDR